MSKRTSPNTPNEYLFRYSDEQKARVEDFRYSYRAPNFATTLRKLLDLGLEAAAQKAAK